MSTEGSAKVPIDWRIKGEVNLQQQADWYSTMFETAGKRDFVNGFCFWSWAWKQYSLKAALKDGGYDIYGKPAEEVVRKFFQSRG